MVWSKRIPRLRLFFAVGAFLILSSLVLAQTIPKGNQLPIRITDNSETPVYPGDATNQAIRVNVVAGGGSGGTSSTFGAGFPGTGTATGFKDSAGINMEPGNLDASGNLKVNVAAGGAGDGKILDGTAAGQADVVGSAPAGAEQGLVVRNIPSGTQPVSGAVTANAGTNLNTSALALETGGNLATLAGAVAGAEMQVDVITLPNVTIGTFPDNEPFNLAQIGGATVDKPCARTRSSVAVSTAASGSTELVGLTASQVIYVCGYTFVSSASVSVKFVYGTGTACATGSTDLTGAMAVAANGGVVNAVDDGGIFKTASANALCINLSGATQTSGHVTYVKF